MRYEKCLQKFSGRSWGNGQLGRPKVNGRIILKLASKECASVHFEEPGVSRRLLLKWILKEFGRDPLELVGKDTVKVDIKSDNSGHHREHGNEP
jgi:hypothetical protein